jgi:hypothetical protein
VETIAPPKIIPVYYTSAEEVAAVVREVFAPQIAAGRGTQRTPSPEEFIRALRGGRGRESSSRRSQQEQQLMTVGIDARSNSLVVSAPEPLLRQVEQLVAELDRAGVESEQTMRVVSIRRADPAIVHQALAALVGQSRGTTAGRTSTSPAASRTRTSSQARTIPTPAASTDQMRRQMMMLNSLRGAAGSRTPAPPVTPTFRPGTRGPGMRSR